MKYIGLAKIAKRCGTCPNCKRVADVKRLLFKTKGPTFHGDKDYQQALRDYPCTHTT